MVQFPAIRLSGLKSILCSFLCLCGVVRAQNATSAVSVSAVSTGAATAAIAPVGATGPVHEANATSAVPSSVAAESGEKRGFFGRIFGGTSKPAAAVSNAPAAARLVKKFADAAEAQAFVQALEVKRTIALQLQVVEGLQAEKQAELARFAARLQEAFGVDPARQYEFLTDTFELIEISTNAPQATGQVRRVAAKIDDATKRGEFIRLSGARTITQEELAALALIAAEKRLERQQSERQLQERYGIIPAKSYQYVGEERALYEVPPAAADPAVKSGDSTAR